MKTTKRLSLFLALLFMATFTVSAQASNIKGKVILETGEPAVGAKVIIKNTAHKTATDSFGNYSLQLPNGEYTMQVSLLGYQTHLEKITIHASTTSTLPVIVLTSGNEQLKAVVVTAKRDMHIRRHNGKLTVNVNNTNFEDTRNVWEGLKKVPLLNVGEQGIQLFGKDVIVEINGVKTHMGGDQLEAYLKSLDPESIERIEMEPNPGAAYGAHIGAYINIVLKHGANNYRLGLKTTNGSYTHYFNRSNVNYALNLKNFSLYTNYDFSYIPDDVDGEIAKRIGQGPLTAYHTSNHEISRAHNALVNLSFEIGKKDRLVLNNYVSFSNEDARNLTQNANLKRKVFLHDKSHRLQFSQVWKHNFNDTVSLKIGAYEVFQKAKAHNLALNNGQNPHTQEISTTIPIYIAFADYKNKNAWGTTTAGLKYKAISVQNDNHNFGIQEYSAPYHYNEKVVAAYVNHRLDFDNGSSLSLGLRSETSIIDYKFNAANSQESFSAQPRYTNLFYSVQYNWMTSGKRLYNIAFRKTIERPTYSALNPFQTISDNGVYTGGDSRLDPAQKYILSFYTHKNHLTFSGFAGYINQFIANMYQVQHDQLTVAYQNLKNVYALGTGVHYTNNFFEGIWTTKAALQFRYIALNDPDYEVGETKPYFWIDSNNTIKISDGFQAGIDFWFRPDKTVAGLGRRESSSRLDLSLTKHFGNNFTVILYANDIFRTNRNDFETTVSGFYYKYYRYPDVQSIGLTLKYSITGKAYEKRHVQKPDDAAIERLD